MVKKLIYFIIFLLIICFSFAIYAHTLIKKTARQTPPSHVSYIIVLGAKVNGSVMSLSLMNRVQKALTYLQENPDSKVIATGGQGPGEDITEAEAISAYLIENGIAPERVLLEDTSTTTYENLLFSKKLYDLEEAIIVSSDFHLYRAIHNAESLGIKAYPLAADTPDIVKWKLYIREYAAILKLKLFLNILLNN